MRKLTQSDDNAKYYVSTLTLMHKCQLLCTYVEVDANTDTDPCIDDGLYNDIYAKKSQNYHAC